MKLSFIYLFKLNFQGKFLIFREKKWEKIFEFFGNDFSLILFKRRFFMISVNKKQKNNRNYNYSNLTFLQIKIDILFALFITSINKNYPFIQIVQIVNFFISDTTILECKDFPT